MSARAEANLAGDFPPATEEQWLAAVDSVLKGKPFESLVSTTADGISVPPLYVRESSPGARDEAGFPGAAPFTRGSFPHSRPNGAWDVRGVVTPGDAGDANRRLLDDLGRGVTSVVVDRPDPATLGAVLDGVYLDLAPIVLRAGDDFVAASRALEAVWAERGVHPSDALGGFGADPLASILGGHGSSDLASRLAELGTLAARTAETYPKVRAVSVSTLAYVEAGATETQELAAMLSTGVAYLRAMSDAGMSIDDACRQIEVTVGVDADVFTSIAKLRAARRVWGTMTAACGASPSAQAPSIYAHTARPDAHPARSVGEPAAGDGSHVRRGSRGSRWAHDARVRCPVPTSRGSSVIAWPATPSCCCRRSRTSDGSSTRSAAPATWSRSRMSWRRSHGRSSGTSRRRAGSPTP